MMRQLRIAVADDEDDMRDFLRLGLSRIGHAVVAVAATGRELVELALSCRPDLIMTDLLMPEMSGVDAVLEIARQHPTPVIFVSAVIQPDAISRIPADLAFGVLTKPVRIGDLEPAIRDLMRRWALNVGNRTERTAEATGTGTSPTTVGPDGRSAGDDYSSNFLPRGLAGPAEIASAREVELENGNAQ